MDNYRVTDPAILKGLLERADITPNHSAGQNFMICQEPVEAVVAAAAGGPNKITELGAGVGALTQALLAQGFGVRAIERDKSLIHILEQAVPKKIQSALVIEPGDLRKIDWTWDEPYQVIGNIPYNLSGLILRRLTQLKPAPQQAIILVQKEVGQRLVAKPPQASLLSVAVQLWGETSTLMNVPLSCFWPAPKVSSQLILLTPHAQADSETETREQIIALAKTFFQAKRKQMLGTLKRSRQLAQEDAEHFLSQADIKPKQRPQEIELEQWRRLHQALG